MTTPMTNVAEWKFDRGGWLLISDIRHLKLCR
jgi:hypothetical protein